MVSHPDPTSELRVRGLRTLRGANYWSGRPVTRLDLQVGAFDEISSAAVPGFASRLMEALPGLREHRCSIGRPGGFELRLRRGTYAPHIVEHVALELQSVIGHRVGYGRARGGDRPGEYTVIVEHRHSEVGRHSLLQAVELVRAGLSGESIEAAPALESLARVAAGRDPCPAVDKHVACGIVGGGERGEVREEILRQGAACPAEIVAISPATLLAEGLPYSSSETAVILDLLPEAGLPERYRDPGAIRRLYSVVTDGVAQDGWVVIPEGDGELQMIVHQAKVRPATFGPDGEAGVALQSTRAGGSIVVMVRGRCVRRSPAPPSAGEPARMAAAVVNWILEHPR